MMSNEISCSFPGWVFAVDMFTPGSSTDSIVGLVYSKFGLNSLMRCTTQLHEKKTINSHNRKKVYLSQLLTEVKDI